VAAESFFHVGVIVPELEPALKGFSELLGYSWRPTVESPVDVHEPGRGERTLHIRFAYSQEAPHLEVIEAIPDSPWALSEGSNIHHLGFWSDSVAAGSERLEGFGCPLEIGSTGFAYHHALGVRVELLDRRAQSVLLG
jgi:hypothetical protein